MTIPSRLMGSGFAAQAAINVCGDVAATLTASGTTNADALQLGAAINHVSTAAAGSGVKLPPTEVGMGVTVINLGANAVLVYPAAFSQINALALTTGGFSVGAGKSATFLGITGTLVGSNLSA